MQYFWLYVFIFLPSLSFSKQVIPHSELKIGYVEFHPYLYTNKNGETTGPVVDYINRIIPKNISIKYIETPISRVRYSLNTGIIDVFSIYFFSEERAKHLHYIQPAYHKFEPQLCSFDKNLQTDISYLKNKTLIHFRGTLKNSTPLKTDEIKRIEIDAKNFKEVAFKLLELRRADMVYFPDRFAFNQSSHKEIHCKNVESTKNALHFVLKKNSIWSDFIEAQISKTGATFSINKLEN
jgi:hypothetical protein